MLVAICPHLPINPPCCAVATAFKAWLGDGHVKFHSAGECDVLTTVATTPAPDAAAPGAERDNVVY